MNIYVVYDNLQKRASGLPFFQPNHDCAIRQLKAQFLGCKFDLSTFDCRHIANFNDETCLVSSFDSSIVLFTLDEIIEAPKD